MEKAKYLKHLKEHTNPQTLKIEDKEVHAALLVGLSSEDHIANGYKGNSGRDRIVRKDGSIDYLKMSRLYHEGNW